MKTFFWAATVVFFSLVSNAKQVEVTGPVARDLMLALYQSGVELLETAEGAETVKVNRIICKGGREHAFTGGLLHSTDCHKNIEFGESGSSSTLLPNSVNLERALGQAGADSDAGMGQWWVYVEGLSCKIELLQGAKYSCQFQKLNN